MNNRWLDPGPDNRRLDPAAPEDHRAATRSADTAAPPEPGRPAAPTLTLPDSPGAAQHRPGTPVPGVVDGPAPTAPPPFPPERRTTMPGATALIITLLTLILSAVGYGAVTLADKAGEWFPPAGGTASAEETAGDDYGGYGSIEEYCAAEPNDYGCIMRRWTNGVMDAPIEASTEATGFFFWDSEGTEIRCAFGEGFGIGACATLRDYWELDNRPPQHSVNLASGLPLGDPDDDSPIAGTAAAVWDGGVEYLPADRKIALPDGQGWIYYDLGILMRGGIDGDEQSPVVYLEDSIWMFLRDD